MTWLFDLWTPASALAVLIGGLTTGALVISRPVLDPTFTSGVAPPRAYGLLVGFLCAFLGAVFFTGQAIEALFADGPVELVLSRFTLWLLFSVATGAGVWLRVRTR